MTLNPKTLNKILSEVSPADSQGRNEAFVELRFELSDPIEGFKSLEGIDELLKDPQLKKEYDILDKKLDDLAIKMFNRQGTDELKKEKDLVDDIIDSIRNLQRDLFYVTIDSGHPGLFKLNSIANQLIRQIGEQKSNYPYKFMDVRDELLKLNSYRQFTQNLNYQDKKDFITLIDQGMSPGNAVRYAKMGSPISSKKEIPTKEKPGNYPGDASYTYYIDNDQWYAYSIKTQKTTNLSASSKYAKSIDKLNKHFGTNIKISDQKAATRSELSDEGSGKQGTIGSSKSGDQILLDFISKFESGGYYYAVNNGKSGDLGTSPSQWKAYWENNHGRLPTEMTIGDIKKLQAYEKGPYRSNKRQIFAVGKYQIIPKTLFAALEMEPISDDTLFDEATQDRLGRVLIYKKRPGLGKYLSGENNNINQAMLELAMEFASFPVPYDIKNSKKGETYYPGKGNNKAHYSVDEVKTMLKKARKANSVKEAPPQKYVYIADSQGFSGLGRAIKKRMGPATAGKNFFQKNGATAAAIISEFGEEIKSAVRNTQNIIFTLGGNGSDKASFLAKDVLENAPESAKITWILAPPAIQPTSSTKYVNTPGKPERQVDKYKATRAKYNKEITDGIKAVEAQLGMRNRINIIDPYPWFEENVESSLDGVHVDNQPGEKYIATIESELKPTSQSAITLKENLAINENTLRILISNLLSESELTSPEFQKQKQKENEIEYNSIIQTLPQRYPEIISSKLFGINVYHKKHVDINVMDDKTKQMLASLTLRAKLNGVMPPLITDGFRTGKDQASRMWAHWWNYETNKGKLKPTKTNGKGRKHLVGLYAKDEYANGVADIYERIYYAKVEVPRLKRDGTIKSKLEIEQAQKAAKDIKNIKKRCIEEAGAYLEKNNISNHQVSSAFDIRTKEGLQKDVESIIFHSDFKGLIKVNDETKSKAGPHYHITVVKPPLKKYLDMLKNNMSVAKK